MKMSMWLPREIRLACVACVRVCVCVGMWLWADVSDEQIEDGRDWGRKGGWLGHGRLKSPARGGVVKVRGVDVGGTGPSSRVACLSQGSTASRPLGSDQRPCCSACAQTTGKH